MRIKECSIVSLFLNPAVCILRDAGGISPYPQNPRYVRASGILVYFPIYPCILLRLSLHTCPFILASVAMEAESLLESD